MVRLKEKTEQGYKMQKGNFNSSMVRLKAPSSTAVIRIFLFQFQYGAIKSQRSNAGADSTTLFQFQYGAIKRISSSSCCVNSLDFNSSMVRLKEGAATMNLKLLSYFNSSMVRLKVFPISASSQNIIFQFQYGAIKSCLRIG